MVTAASEARHVSELYSYGVSDYLIKPFDYNRFQTALQKFVARKEAFSGDKAFNQEELDKVIAPEGPAPAASLWTRASTRSPWRSSAPSCGSTRAKSSPSKTSSKTSPSPGDPAAVHELPHRQKQRHRRRGLLHRWPAFGSVHLHRQVRPLPRTPVGSPREFPFYTIL